MIPLKREPIFHGTRPLGVTLASLDLDLIRRLYLELFDEAAQTVQLAGYEQDDSIVERFATCRIAGGPTQSIRVDALSDAARLMNDILTKLRRAGGTAPDPAAVQVIELGVEAVLERWA